MASRKELLAAFAKMETEREVVINSIRAIPADKLVTKPQQNQWSVTEIILHLVKAEEGALKYMQIKLKHGGHKKATIGAAIKHRLLTTAIALPFKYKAPNVIKLGEIGSTSFAQAVEQWASIRNQLKNEYESIDEEIIDHELFKHPVAGKLSIMQSVKFMRRHMNRHVGQINRTIKQAG